MQVYLTQQLHVKLKHVVCVCLSVCLDCSLLSCPLHVSSLIGVWGIYISLFHVGTKSVLYVMRLHISDMIYVIIFCFVNSQLFQQAPPAFAFIHFPICPVSGKTKKKVSPQHDAATTMYYCVKRKLYLESHLSSVLFDACVLRPNPMFYGRS